MGRKSEDGEVGGTSGTGETGGRLGNWRLEPCRTSRACRSSKKFLGFDFFKDVTLEIARAAKEAPLGSGHRQARFKFALD